MDGYWIAALAAWGVSMAALLLLVGRARSKQATATGRGAGGRRRSGRNGSV